MRPAAFVGWLYAMAFACLVAGLGGGSWAWFLGALGFFGIAQFARRQWSREREDGGGGARLGFIALAMLLMVAAIYGLFVLSTAG